MVGFLVPIFAPNSRVGCAPFDFAQGWLCTPNLTGGYPPDGGKAASQLLELRSEGFGVLEDLLAGGGPAGLELEGPLVAIDDAAGVEDLGEKIEWGMVVPRGPQLTGRIERLVAVLGDPDAVVAVPVEGHRHRRNADLLVVERHQSALGFRVDRQFSFHATGQ